MGRFFFPVILFCLISLLFPICSAHYVIKAINVFMERLFHVAIKHIGSHGAAEHARRAAPDEARVHFVHICVWCKWLKKIWANKWGEGFVGHLCGF